MLIYSLILLCKSELAKLGDVSKNLNWSTKGNDPMFTWGPSGDETPECLACNQHWIPLRHKMDACSNCSLVGHRYTWQRNASIDNSPFIHVKKELEWFFETCFSFALNSRSLKSSAH